MLFDHIEPLDSTGTTFPTDTSCIYQCTFQNDVSQQLTLLPDIDDEGVPQDIRMETVVPDAQFYEFVAPDPYRRIDNFNTGNPFSFDFKIRRKPQAGLAIPCRIRTTVFFMVVIDGKNKKQQRSQSMFIQ